MAQQRMVLGISVICMLTVWTNAASLEVNTTSGMIQGKINTFNGKEIHEFQNIPYAEPPQRFMPPEPKARMEGMVDATNDTAIVCPQNLTQDMELPNLFERDITGNISFVILEDCLCLNVYTPSSVSLDNPVAVMVWIHGGGFVFGSGRLSSGLVLSSQHGIVLVTINYRMGALGFLNTEDDNAIGNFGLLDQIMALRWVKANIGQFGGDADRITVAGESAGGVSISLLTMSPLTEGLFKRAIMESANPFGPGFYQPAPLSNARLFAEKMACPTESTKSLVDCLNLKTIEEIITGQVVGAWVPTFDGSIFAISPLEVENQLNSDVAKRLAKVDLLIGVNAQEGAVWLESTARTINSSYLIEGIPKDYYDTTLSQMVTLRIPSAYASSLLPIVRYKYTDWTMADNSFSRARMLTYMVGDILFYTDAVRFARLHTQVAPDDTDRGSSYFYKFNHRPSWMSHAPWRSGPDHGDELFFVFGNPQEFKLLEATNEEKELSQRIMTYWTNFVKSGDPNGPVSTIPVQWPSYEVGEEQYIRLDTQMSNDSVEQRIFSSRVAFWTHFVPQEIKRLSQIATPPKCEKNTTPTSGSKGTQHVRTQFVNFPLFILLPLLILLL